MEISKQEKIIFSVPNLIIVTGVPGSGKTVLSLGLYDCGIKKEKGVLDFLSAFYIGKDMINDGFIKERSGEYYPIIRKGTYDAIDNIIGRNLELRNSVWVDATYATEVKNRDWAYRYLLMVQRYNSKLKLIRCVGSEDSITERLTNRDYHRDRDKLANLKKFFEDEPIDLYVPYGGMVLDRSGDNLTENRKQVIEFLQK